MVSIQEQFLIARQKKSELTRLNLMARTVILMLVMAQV